jgi:hypothetical protein
MDYADLEVSRGFNYSLETNEILCWRLENRRLREG